LAAISLVDGFCPWEDLVRKNVSKLRFIVELKAFVGLHLALILLANRLSKLFQKKKKM
jgi:hypothetical protein